MLDIVRGNLWDYHPENWCVITTNIGWGARGQAIMGAGVAKQAIMRFPELALWYGAKCQQFGEAIGVEPYRDGLLLLFPTKSLNPTHPHLSWRSDSTMQRIEQSLANLALNVETLLILHDSPIYMPPPGCGHGNLLIEHVYPLLDKHLGPSKADFRLVLS